MVIPAGTRLGPYEILSAIGAGGMGEVYKARDPRLNRHVALKVLPEVFSRDTQRMARFEREAKLLASLNHPNIATIHGLEESGPIRALVMELVEGPTLAERIKWGPIPLDEALSIARQMADAVEYAHDKNVIHRDLKPANIKVKADGTVKVLDFGLAKAMSEDVSEGDMDNSPTLSMAATRQGMILGTAAYMSPEQAKGKSVDRRTDVWSFGCVLYEMLTGKQAFQGEDVTEVLASVINKDPLLDALPPKTPSAIRNLVRRCLEKNLRRRLGHMSEARILLEDVLAGAAPAEPVPAMQRRMLDGLAWSVAAVFFLVALGLGGFAYFRPASQQERPVTRTIINLPPGDQLAANDSAIAISPGGTQVAYVAIRSGTRQIFLRALDSLEAQPLAGTEGAADPFFSPDGQWLGFFADGRLKKISVNGGAAVSLIDTGFLRGASWGPNGTIVFGLSTNTALLQVSDAGGTPRPLIRLAPQESSQRWPELLLGGKEMLFATGGANPQIVAQALSSGLPAIAGERRNLIPGGTAPRYLASGHLVYAQGGNLMAAPFDAQRLQLTSSAVPVVEGVLQLATGATQYDVSATGTLVYIPGSAQSTAEQLVWVSRNGTEQALPAPAHNYTFLRLSPAGRRAAVTITEQEQQIWLYDFTRGTLTRFTFGGTSNVNPVWTPDGKRIAFSSNNSNKDGAVNILWQLSDGSGGLERLTTSAHNQIPRSFSPDGQTLAYLEAAPEAGLDIWTLQLSDHKAQPFLQTLSNESVPSFSPDGHWLSYVSDESGRFEVYVQPYPGPAGKYQISTQGGSEPAWNPNGKELFYRSGDKMMAVGVITQPSFAAGNPKMLFQGPYVPSAATFPYYDVSPDGQRFLMIKPVEQTSSSLTQIVVVLNWTEELKQKVPAGQK